MFVGVKSLSHAIWTENSPATAARLIDDRLAPLIRGLLGSQLPGPALQVIAEFASDFFSACTQRSSDACLVPGDRRMVFRVELSVSIRPRLAGTDLEFYAAQMGS